VSDFASNLEYGIFAGGFSGIDCTFRAANVICETNPVPQMETIVQVVMNSLQDGGAKCA
jgi:hypothetical protein